MISAHGSTAASAVVDVAVPALFLLGLGVPVLRTLRLSRVSAPRRAAAWGGGLLVLALALAWPLGWYADDLLVLHMAQHLLLLLVAAPLLVLADPLPAVVPRLPDRLRHPARRLWRWATRSSRSGRWAVGVAVLHVAVVTGWHVPALYDAALRLPLLHAAEHLAFLGAGVLFWWTVLEPRPASRTQPLLAALGGVLVAGTAGALLGLLMMFSTTPWYGAYAWRVGAGLGPLADQQAAGALMWGAGAPAYLVAVLVLLLRLVRLSPSGSTADGSSPAPAVVPAALR